MAEIEHFCDPRDKSHPKFEEVAEVEAALYSACDQMDGKPAKKIKIGHAVREVRQMAMFHSQKVRKRHPFLILLVLFSILTVRSICLRFCAILSCLTQKSSL